MKINGVDLKIPSQFLIRVEPIGYALFLDDVRDPNSSWMNYCMQCRDYDLVKWTIARSFDEFKAIIDEKGMPDFISYDHDLHDEHYDGSMWLGLNEYNEVAKNFKHPTGLECAQYVLEKLGDKVHPPFFPHTQNPIGYMRIMALIADHNSKVLDFKCPWST